MTPDTTGCGYLVLIPLVLLFAAAPACGGMVELEGTELASVTATQGLQIDINLELIVDSLEISGDGAGCPACSANPGVLLLGSGTDGLVINNGSGGVAPLTSLAVDIDRSNGIVLNLPSGKFNVRVDETRIGTTSSGDRTLGFEAADLNFNSTFLRVNNH